MHRHLYPAVATALIFLGLALSVVAQEGPSDDDVNRVARQMVCPVCEGIPLDVCTTEACSQWRAEIRAQLAAGHSDEEIKAEFVRQYGERVLALPLAAGFTLGVWVLPPLALVLGGLGLWAYLRRPRTSEPAGLSPVADPAALAEIEREVRERL
ncbi:MAG: cytochrome c-type biogenesis protein CcmH [Anaerolineales bacterium]|nr:cytochrome c-type biogenesis protein CcmH [Anaerolineales bacterium]